MIKKLFDKVFSRTQTMGISLGNTREFGVVLRRLKLCDYNYALNLRFKMFKKLNDAIR